MAQKLCLWYYYYFVWHHRFVLGDTRNFGNSFASRSRNFVNFEEKSQLLLFKGTIIIACNS